MLARVTSYLIVLSALALAFVACGEPYTPRSYRYRDASVTYATICHAGRRTLTLPSEDWPRHREHGDYRGPCRATGIVPGKEPRKADHTDIDYRGRKDRAKWSEEEWSRMQTDALLKRLADSIATTREVEPSSPDR